MWKIGAFWPQLVLVSAAD